MGVFSEKSLELPSSLFLFFPSLAPQIRIQFKFSIHSSAYGTLVFQKASSKHHSFFVHCILPSPHNSPHKLNLLVDWKERLNIQFTFTEQFHLFCCAFWRNQCSARKYILNPRALTFILFSNIPQQIQIWRKVKNEIYADWILGGTAPVLKWPLQIAQSHPIECKFNWI